MAELSADLKLAPHRVVETSSRTEKVLSLGADVEIHASDQLYLIDAARVCPPTRPRSDAREIFRNVFRPEFLRDHYHGPPISSDAFSRFGLPNCEEHNAVAQAATKFLLEEHVPRVARMLTPAHCQKGLSSFLHLNGVNVRYTGLVAAHVVNPVTRA